MTLNDYVLDLRYYSGKALTSRQMTKRLQSVCCYIFMKYRRRFIEKYSSFYAYKLY